MTTPTNPHNHIRDTILPRIQNRQQPQTVDKGIRKGRREEKEPVTDIPLGHPVMVLWIDATSVAISWEETDQTYIPEPTVSIGFLWENTDTHITLMAIVNSEHVSHGLVIPTGCITETIPL
jgi:hypothetical protein